MYLSKGNFLHKDVMVKRRIRNEEPKKICPRYSIAPDICGKCHDLSISVKS
jgi:hypothetical protein